MDPLCAGDSCVIIGSRARMKRYAQRSGLSPVTIQAAETSPPLPTGCDVVAHIRSTNRPSVDSFLLHRRLVFRLPTRISPSRRHQVFCRTPCIWFAFSSSDWNEMHTVLSQMRLRFHSTPVKSIDPETALHTLRMVSTGARNRSSLHCSGPTHRSTEQFDLRGLCSPSNGVVEMITVTR